FPIHFLPLVLLFFSVLSVNAALQCYKGQTGSDIKKTSVLDNKKKYLPRLVTCASNQNCCLYSRSPPGTKKLGQTFDCSSQCPDFKGRVEIYQEIMQGGFVRPAYFCKSAGGGCRYDPVVN
ncbi:hypothetical protein PMAYCL1PPCAC_13286, partial [Pristionchus mayeri]